MYFNLYLNSHPSICEFLIKYMFGIKKEFSQKIIGFVTRTKSPKKQYENLLKQQNNKCLEFYCKTKKNEDN